MVGFWGGEGVVCLFVFCGVLWGFFIIKHIKEWLFGNVVLGVTLTALFPRPADHSLFLDSSIPFAETMEASPKEIIDTDMSGKAILSSDHNLVLSFLFHILLYNHASLHHLT